MKFRIYGRGKEFFLPDRVMRVSDDAGTKCFFSKGFRNDDEGVYVPSRASRWGKKKIND